MLLHVYGKMNHLLCPKASFASGIHCQFLCVAQVRNKPNCILVMLYLKLNGDFKAIIKHGTRDA